MDDFIVVSPFDSLNYVLKNTNQRLFRPVSKSDSDIGVGIWVIDIESITGAVKRAILINNIDVENLERLYSAIN